MYLEMEIRGKHALVTGAGKRLGRTIAEALLSKGARLSAHYHQSQEACSELVALAKVKGTRCQIIAGDLSRFSDIEPLADAVEREGPIDILIHSASVFYPRSASETTLEDWERLQNINLRAPFFLSQRLRKRMPKGSVILHLCDTNASHPTRGFAPYHVTKAGLLYLTKVLALEWAPDIRVNAISPGVLLPPEDLAPSSIRTLSDLSWMGRIGGPSDLVSAVYFLLENDYVTGQNIPVDGGAH